MVGNLDETKLGSSTAQGYEGEKKPQTVSLIPGRFLYCIGCEGFARHAIFMDGDEKVIKCQNCESEQARLIRWNGEDWIDKRYTDNLALTVLNVLGEKSVAKTFMPSNGTGK